MSGIIKPGEKSFALVDGKLVTKTSSFQDRVKAAAPTVAAPSAIQDSYNSSPLDRAVLTDPDAMRVPNRIVLMVDCSGSMHGESNRNLHTAGKEFVSACNFADTAVAISTFGLEPDEYDSPLSRHSPSLTSCVTSLPASGSTPMHNCLTRVIDHQPLTRGVLVSDGQATDWQHVRYTEPDVASIASDPTIAKYIEARISIDTVHIGSSTSGEALLQAIARVTGGVFIKFKDTGNFAKAFKFLAPTYRAMLGDGRVNLLDYGASEVKK